MKIHEHTLVARPYLSTLREKSTTPAAFRDAAHRVALALASEVAKTIPDGTCAPAEGYFETVVTSCAVPVYLVPVLRSGLGMLQAFLTFFPSARIGLAGGKHTEGTDEMMRDIKPGETVIVLDPMLATGETLVRMFERNGLHKRTTTHLVSIIAAPEGVARIGELLGSCVDTLHVAAIDRCLNERGYILPGLGDFGDRYFS